MLSGFLREWQGQARGRNVADASELMIAPSFPSEIRCAIPLNPEISRAISVEPEIRSAIPVQNRAFG
jgi:hypothetical protein